MIRTPFNIGFKTPNQIRAMTVLGIVAASTSAAAQEVPSSAAEAQCIETDQIQSYKIETDDLIRFTMAGGEKLVMRLKSYCPQLRFHGYFSYTPMNGRLCAGADEIKTRSGLPCLIGSVVPEAPKQAPTTAN